MSQIASADYLIVYNKGGYTDKSITQHIGYAKAWDKSIVVEEPKEMSLRNYAICCNWR